MDITKMDYTFSGHILGFGEKERAQRLVRLRELMKERQLSCLLLLDKGMDGICQWLTALPGPDIPFHKNGGYIVNLEGPLIEIGGDIVMDEEFYRNERKLDEMPVPHLPIENLKSQAGLSVKDMELKGSRRLGVVHLAHMKKHVRDYLLKCIPNLLMEDVTLPVLELMAVKDDSEIQAMCEVANVHDRLFSMLQYMIRPGQLEKEIVTELRYHSYSMGGAGQDNTRMTIVDLTSAPDGGGSAVEPLKYPGRRLQESDRVNIAVRAINYYDYYAGLGRCFVLGKACAETKKNWHIAVEAQRKAAEVLRPGVSIKAGAEAANQYLRENGVTEDKSAFIYGIGYTVGGVPTLGAATEEIPLQEGMTLVIAPKVKCMGKDSWCCMDTFLITRDGCRRITKTPQNIIECW